MSQTKSTREQLKALESIQELDLRIDSLNGRKNALPAALQTLEGKVAQLRLQLGAKEAAAGEIEKAQRQNKAAQELNQDRLARANGKLEGVANGQEYQAATKEIDQLKKLNESLSQQFTKLGEEAESIQKEAQGIRDQMSEVEKERDAQAAVASTETGKLDEEIAKLQADRGQYTGAVEKRLLMQYDRVRGARAGLGLVPAVAGRCKGCNMMLPPQLYNELQRASSIHQCPSCNRILFAPSAGAPEAHAQT